MITIVDYQMGNLGSIQNMLKRLDIPSKISGSQDDIVKAEKLILPGVGSFDIGMSNLRDSGLLDCLQERIMKHQIPVLGICLGMQLFFTSSEEGSVPGLNWIEGRVVRLREEHPGKTLRVPHMGWNIVHAAHDKSLFAKFVEEPRFYFLHSFYCICEHSEDILGTTDYSVSLTSAVQRRNIYGVQFHPEKSHAFGKQLFENFATI